MFHESEKIFLQFAIKKANYLIQIHCFSLGVHFKLSFFDIWRFLTSLEMTSVLIKGSHFEWSKA